MRRLKENAMLEAEITPTGDVLVEGQHVGSLDGFRFAPDPNADGPDAKALRAAAQKALAGEIAERAERVATAANTDLILAADGTLRWQGAAIARIAEGDDALKPRLILLADEALLAGGARPRPGAHRSLARQSRRDAAEAALRSARRRDAGARRPRHRLPPRRESSASSTVPRSPRRSAPSTRMRAPACARSASASAPITSMCRRC